MQTFNTLYKINIKSITSIDNRLFRIIHENEIKSDINSLKTLSISVNISEIA